MPSPKYPLKPLLEHRERQVDEATVELGGAVRARESADAVRLRAEGVQREAEEAAARIKAAEASLLGRGELRAADLAREQAWVFAAQARIAELARAVDVAAERLAEARGSESDARDELAQRMANRDVVVKDEARFVVANEKRAVAAEEEAAEEAFRGGRSG